MVVVNEELFVTLFTVGDWVFFGIVFLFTLVSFWLFLVTLTALVPFWLFLVTLTALVSFWLFLVTLTALVSFLLLPVTLTALVSFLLLLVTLTAFFLLILLFELLLFTFIFTLSFESLVNDFFFWFLPPTGTAFFLFCFWRYSFNCSALSKYSVNFLLIGSFNLSFFSSFIFFLNWNRCN